MRRTAATFLVLAALGTFVSVGDAGAQSDPRQEARLLYHEGKFAEAERILEAAGADVANDPELRKQLADAADRSLRNKKGEERRGPLEAMKKCLGMVAEAQPTDGAAVTGAVLAAKELAELDLSKKQTEAAMAHATWAVKLGEKAAEAGLSPETKVALGEAYGLRASVTKKVDLADQIIADFRKGAQLLEEAAAGNDKESEWLSGAAALRLKEAIFVHDAIPLETEKRDDEAMTAALGLAKRACEAKGVADPQYEQHLKTLLVAHEWKFPGDWGLPFMKALTPPVQGLELQVPKGVSWPPEEGGDDWELALHRQYDGETNAVQILLCGRDAKASFGTRQWSKIEDVVPLVFEARQGGFGEVTTKVEPVALGGDKKGKGAVWHFELGGIVANSTRPQKLAEWIWEAKTRKNTVWELKILDWRRPSAIDQPDIVAFVDSAIGEGLWPAGRTPPEDPKKKPPKKKK